jgi:hypothetical protein
MPSAPRSSVVIGSPFLFTESFFSIAIDFRKSFARGVQSRCSSLTALLITEEHRGDQQAHKRRNIRVGSPAVADKQVAITSLLHKPGGHMPFNGTTAAKQAANEAGSGPLCDPAPQSPFMCSRWNCAKFEKPNRSQPHSGQGCAQTISSLSETSGCGN